MHCAKARLASWVSAGVDVSVVSASFVESTSSDATCDPDASLPHAVAKLMSAQPSASPMLVERDLGEIRMPSLSAANLRVRCDRPASSPRVRQPAATCAP
jgi:hypothetical protein